MNIAKLVSSAVKSVPNGLKGVATFRRADFDPTHYNAVTGVSTAGADTTFNASIVMVPPKPTRVDGIMQMPVYEQVILVAAADCAFPPEPNVTVEVTVENSRVEKWRIIDSTPLRPDGVTTVLYQLGVKR